MQIPWAHFRVMCACVMFALIICKILLTGMPVKCIHLLCTFVTNPKEPHFHRSRLLSLYIAICDANRRCIIAMYRCFWLGVSHIFKDAAKIIPVWQLWNKAPNSTSAADATTKRITLVLTWNAPLIWIGSPSLGNHPMKK